VPFQCDGIGDHVDMALPTRLRDPRRAGFLAVAIATAYIVALFVNERVGFKLALGTGIAIVLVALVLVMPLPRWREAPERMRVAGIAMVAEAAAFAALATAIRVITR
jgi:hypothetical protein